MRVLIFFAFLFLTSCEGQSEAETLVTSKQKTMPQSLIFDVERGPDDVIMIWPEGPPGETPEGLREHYVERENAFELPDRAVHEVTRPTLSIFRPANPDGSAILLIPGGGYKWVVVEKEGFEGARWFNREGVTVYVMSYRLPHQGWTAGPDTPLQDAQRAMRVIRSRAVNDEIDPNRVMVMGFSAGGHLAGSLTTRFSESVYPAVDSADTFSARPDACVLVYPVITLKQPFTHGSTRENMLGENPTANDLDKYSVETAPPNNAPPVFILHASDDEAVPVENALLAYRAFREARISSSLHIFDHGGHGFGLRGIDDDPLSQWPDLVMDWGRSQEIFSAVDNTEQKSP